MYLILTIYLESIDVFLFALQKHELGKEIDKNKPHVFHGYFLWRAGTYAIFY